MPSLIVPPAPANFIVNGVKGWETRAIFTYFGSPVDYTSLYDSVDNGFTTDVNLFDQLYQTELVKGGFKFPWNYFTTGKSLKIRARFIIDPNSSAKLASAFGVYNKKNDTIYKIAYINGEDGNYNNFANSSNTEAVPVDFELVLNSYVDSSNTFFQACGRFQYEFETFGGSGGNTSVAYVPVWKKTAGYVSCASVSDEDLIHIYMDFRGSDAINMLACQYLIVEELS